jgi:hypothetical protein
MRSRSLAVVTLLIAAVMSLAMVGVVTAQTVTLTIKPDHVVKDMQTQVKMTASIPLPLPPPPAPKETPKVTVGGQDATVEGEIQDKTTLTVTLPKLDIAGTAFVVVRIKDKVVATGNVVYVEPAPPSPEIGWVWTVGLVAFYVALIVAFPWCLTLADVNHAYREQRQARLELVQKLPSSISTEDAKLLIAEIDRGPAGIKALTRGAVALTLLMILGIAVFHIMVLTPKVPDVVEKLLTLLAGAFTSITGFYFGTRASESAQPAPPPVPRPGAASGGPSITSVTPPSGGLGDPIILTGLGFGSSGTVAFGGTIVPSTSWTDTKIEVRVPSVPALPPGTIKLAVTPAGGTPVQTDFIVNPAITGAPAPPKAPVGLKVTLKGSFGKDQGTVMFGNTEAAKTDIVSWTNDEIVVQVPAGVTGKPPIIVKAKTGESSKPVDFEVDSSASA